MVRGWEVGVSNSDCRYIKSLRQRLYYIKIRTLDVMAKSFEKMSTMLKKNFVYLGLEKNELK